MTHCFPLDRSSLEGRAKHGVQLRGRDTIPERPQIWSQPGLPLPSWVISGQSLQPRWPHLYMIRWLP